MRFSVTWLDYVEGGMSDAQTGALCAMFMVGMLPLGPYFGFGDELPRFWRIAIPIWAIFWATPPMLMLWIRGVFG